MKRNRWQRAAPLRPVQFGLDLWCQFDAERSVNQLLLGGSYTCVVTSTLNSNPSTRTSAAAALTVLTVQPTPQTVSQAATATFSVTATSGRAGTISYQWKRDTTNVGTSAKR